jgi:hypothetical protein
MGIPIYDFYFNIFIPETEEAKKWNNAYNFILQFENIDSKEKL